MSNEPKEEGMPGVDRAGREVVVNNTRGKRELAHGGLVGINKILTFTLRR